MFITISTFWQIPVRALWHKEHSSHEWQHKDSAGRSQLPPVEPVAHDEGQEDAQCPHELDEAAKHPPHVSAGHLHNVDGGGGHHSPRPHTGHEPPYTIQQSKTC